MAAAAYDKQDGSVSSRHPAQVSKSAKILKYAQHFSKVKSHKHVRAENIQKKLGARFCLTVVVRAEKLSRGSLWSHIVLGYCERYDTVMITLAISKCYGKVRVLFFRSTTLVSARKSHSSGVRGLVVRCLLFNPEGSCLNPWVCANFFTSIPKQKVLTFSALRDSSLFSALWDFFSKTF